jgi:hypothetical protein
MLMSKVEQMKIRYDPSKESLRLVAEFYKGVHPSAYNMLIAAYKREKEIEAGPSSAPAPTTNHTTKKSIPTKSQAIQKGLEAEMEAWMTRNRKANA